MIQSISTMIFCSGDFGAVAPGTRVEDKGRTIKQNPKKKIGTKNRGVIAKRTNWETNAFGVPNFEKPTVLGYPIRIRTIQFMC